MLKSPNSCLILSAIHIVLQIGTEPDLRNIKFNYTRNIQDIRIFNRVHYINR